MSQRPRVSILLPNLNHRAFLDERLATIRAQTLSDWELVVTDSFSDDGAWEILQAAADGDARIKLAQAPRDGVYSNWNRCIARAQGEFVYIATSDDTMSADCLAKLVAALEAHPECGIAQCCLDAIDEDGRVIDNWWKLVGAAQFLGDRYLRPHVRRAPVDGILHCGMATTLYHSITQLLVRREVFALAGSFPTQWGSAGDFEWGLRAGLLCDVVHVPEFLATWRIHGVQASSTYRCDSAQFLKMQRMAEAALDQVGPRLPAADRLPGRMELLFAFRHARWRAAWAESTSFVARARVVAAMAVDDWATFRRIVRMRANGTFRTFAPREHAQELLERSGLAGRIAELQQAHGAPASPAA